VTFVTSANTILKMTTKKLYDIVGNTDIYVLDQILKDRYGSTDKILDAGVGHGRNLHWFYHNGYDIWGVDKDSSYLEYLKQMYPSKTNNFLASELSSTPFEDHFFDHIICSAVLHFANNRKHFMNMLAELIRVLKPNGSLLIRIASNIGIKGYVTHIENGIYSLGDESERFLLTKALLDEAIHQNNLSFLEPLKSTNVSDLRCMSTLLLQKDSVIK